MICYCHFFIDQRKDAPNISLSTDGQEYNDDGYKEEELKYKDVIRNIDSESKTDPKHSQSKEDLIVREQITTLKQ